MQTDILQEYLSLKYSNIFFDIKLEEIHESNNNQVFSFGNYIIKVSQNKDNLKNEFEYLKLLENKGKFPTPISYDIQNNNYILVISRLDGRGLNYTWIKLSPNEKNLIIEDIIEQMKIIHSVEIPDRVGVPYISDVLLKIDQILPSILTNANVGNDEINNIKNEIEKYKLCFDDSKISLVHNDLWYKNILIYNKKMTGIIDFELGFFGPIQLDFFRLLHHQLSVLNYTDKEPEHYEELGFLRMFMELIKSNYSELFEKICLEQFYVYNLYSYLVKLSKHKETWYNHEETLEFKKEYCDLVNLKDFLKEYIA